MIVPGDISPARNQAAFPVGDLDLLARRSNLTKTQLLIWIGQMLHPDAPLYNMAFTFDIKGPVEPVHFQRAVQALIDRSEALRTVVRVVDGIPQQAVIPARPYRVECHDVSGGADPEAEARAWSAARSRLVLDLETGLFDTALLKLAGERFVWYLNQHHLICDAWSTLLLFQDVSEGYARSLAGALDARPALPSFQAFLDYERAGREAPQGARARAHWEEQSAGTEAEPLRLYGAHVPRPGPRMGRVTCTLGRARSDRWRALAQEPELRSLTPDLSLFNLFATILFAYLYRVSGQRTLAIGVPAHNRPTGLLKEIPGVLIEMFPLGVEVGAEDTFRSLLDRVRTESIAFLRNAHPGTSRPEANARFNTVLNYLNVSFPDFNGWTKTTGWVHPGFGDFNHYLRLQVHDLDGTGEWTLFFDVNDDVVPEAQRGWAAAHFLRLMDVFLDDPEQSIRRVDIVTEAERRQLLAWSTTNAEALYEPSLSGQTILQAFDAQVAQGPDRPAVVFPAGTQPEGQRLTYRELDVRANRLARYLKRQGVQPGALVGMYLDRSLELIVGILGILKAGAAYLPMDPVYPADRLAFMLEDAQVAALVTQERLARRLPAHETRTVRLDTEAREIEHEAETPPPIAVRPDDLAYVIYTSGSTGQPKGSMVEHRSVVSLVDGLRERIYRAYPGRLNVALVAPCVFDASVQQIFGALLQGHALYVVPESARTDGAELYTLYQAHRIDVSDGTPAHLRLLLEGTGPQPTRLHVRHFIIGGEALPAQVVEQFLERFRPSGPRITNIYGVAECCVDSVAHEVTTADLEAHNTIPIGTPLLHERVYVLDEENRMQPAGVPGELCLGGAGVGRGYLNREALTAVRFVENPFRPGERLYRTGDQARFLPDGRLRFLGRQDAQVKIRGYRIELGEIEHALRAYMAYRAPRLDPASVTDPPAGARRCVRCLLSSGYPGVRFDEAGVCNVCREYETLRPHMERYFQPFSGFEQLVEQARATNQSDYDCMLLYSGGKDSSYVLYRLVDMGLKVLAFTFDNGFISAAAFDNIRRQTERLGVDSIVARTNHMDEIFVESLNADHTVCTGCFKSLTSISTRIAQDKGINMIITGLSRGQIFETKLEGLYRQGIYDVAEIEEKLLLFRKMFHAGGDRTARLLDVDLSDVPFDDLYFVDFFRYDRTPVEDIRAYLQTRDSYWSRPKDTGFCSSNCMMNDIGICVHSREKGYHNYEAPLSWDIRLGISTREQVLPEVESEIDVQRVNKVLDKIGYFVRQIRDVAVLDLDDEDGNKYLCAYFVANQKLTVSELRAYLSASLPEYMIPSHFVQVERIPLTPNGKVDHRALRTPDVSRPVLDTGYTPPRNPTEEMLATIWSDVLRLEQVGIHDRFLELGGDSLRAIRIMGRVNETFQIELPPQSIFETPTIAAQAAHIEAVLTAELEALSEDEAAHLARQMGTA